MALRLVGAAGLITGCGTRQQVGAVWKMPDLAESDPVPTMTAAGAPGWAARGHAMGPDAMASGGKAPPLVVQVGDLPDGAHGGPRLGLWHTIEAVGWHEARRTGRPLVVDFHADWCTPCMLMERRVYSDSAVRRELASHFVPLRVDVTEDSMAGREQLERFRVTGLPAVIVIHPAGREIDRIDRFLEVEDLLDRLAKARQK